MISADDLPRHLLGAYGARHGLTPNLDAIADDHGSVVFDQALTVSPLCTPSRFALLNGRFPSMAPNLANRQPPRWIQFNTYMDATCNRTSLPAQLSLRGYRSIFLGKWHLSECSRAETLRPYSSPAEQELDEERTVCEAAGFDHASDVYFSWYTLFLAQQQDGTERDGHNPEWMAAMAVEHMRAAHEVARVPFFVYLAPTLTHGPHNISALLQSEPRAGGPLRVQTGHEAFLATARAARQRVLLRLLQARVLCREGSTLSTCLAKDSTPVDQWLPSTPYESAPRTRQDRLYYHTRVLERLQGAAWLDSSLEPVFQYASSIGAITIFTSDHGADYNGKGHAYEAGVTVPLIWKNPSTLAGPSLRINARVTHMDLLPTILALTGSVGDSVQLDGAPQSGRVGLDLSPLLRPQRIALGSRTEALGTAVDATLKVRTILVEVGRSRSLLRDEMKLIWVWAQHANSGQGSPSDFATCVSVHGLPLPNPLARSMWLFDGYKRHPASYCDRVQLYNLTSDPAETSNLAVAQRREAFEMASAMEAAMQHELTSPSDRARYRADFTVAYHVTAAANRSALLVSNASLLSADVAACCASEHWPACALAVPER